jgi:hypothetical protein
MILMTPRRRSTSRCGAVDRRKVMAVLAHDLADWRGRLEAIARRLDRLAPDRRDPDRYFEEKSDLVGELRKMAHEKQSKD